MTAPKAHSHKVLRRGLALMIGTTLVLGCVALFRSGGAHDPFSELEEDHEFHDKVGAVLNTPRQHGGTPEEQLRVVDEQLRADPNNASLIASKIHLGLECAPAAAAQECRRILEQSPGNYFALHHAAMAYLAMTNLDRALHFASKSLQARDTIEARFVAGHVFYAKGDFPNALNHYRTILEKNPTDGTARAYVEKTERALAAGPVATKRPHINLASPN
jgi:tetratricopeptide (TPR) repeat protein